MSSLLVHCAISVFSFIHVCMKHHKAHEVTVALVLRLCLFFGVGVVNGVADWLHELVNMKSDNVFDNAMNLVWLAHVTANTMIPTWRATKSVRGTLKAALWNRVCTEVEIVAFACLFYAGVACFVGVARAFT